MTTYRELSMALLRAWGADTAFADWDAVLPSMNQCAVTALVVQDYFGGELLRCDLSDGGSHYWNLLADGNELDLTFEQFACNPATLVGIPIFKTREYVLSFPITQQRYDLLKNRVKLLLDSEASKLEPAANALALLDGAPSAPHVE